jgi:hypothetical protein
MIRVPLMVLLILLSGVTAAQDSDDAIPASAVVAAAVGAGSDVSDDSRLHFSAGAGVLTFHGDGIKSDPRVSFELRGEYDLSDPWYVYLGYVYGQAVVEDEEWAVLPFPGPAFLAPGLRLRFLGLIPLPPIPGPTVDQPPLVLPPIPIIGPGFGLKLRRAFIPVPFKRDDGDDDHDVHIVTAGPGLRFEEWDRLSLNWDVGSCVVFGDEVDSHLALNTSLRGTWQMTDRASLNLSLMGTLTNTEIGVADLDWGWGGHAGLSIALGPGK